MLYWLVALLWLAMSQVSLAAGPFCTTPQTATVNSGDSVTFDVSNCDGPDNFGMADPGVPPSHGSYVLTGQLDGAGTERVTYTNNGDGATSDSFYVEDNESPANRIVFNITINPSRTASIAVSPSSRSEDSGAPFTYTVTLSDTSASATTVNLSRSGTATSGTDYTGAVNSVVVPANTTTASFNVTPVADGTLEANETVIYSVASGSGYGIGSPSSATGTILNDDQPSLSINDVSVNEGDSGTSNATFTVSLSQPAGAGGVSFEIATADGTATAGVDYVNASLTGQTIPAGSNSATFTVLVNGDTLNELSEAFFVNVSNVTGASVTDAQGLGTIVNDDALPSLSINDVSVNEGNSGTTTATFTVSLSAASGQTVSVNYATADATATGGSDYVARSGTLTFAPGTTAQGVAVTINGDTTVEPNETVSVGLSGASNASIGRATGTGTITNDDAVVTVGPASLPSATAGSAYSQTLTASGGTAPYTFAVSAGTLPAGLSFSAAGVLSGTPTSSGSFNFTATAIDSGTPTSGNRAYTLTVASPTVILSATSLPGGTVGQAYTAAINAATGGIAPYTYALSAGALPAGITVNSATGALSGTPTMAGTFAFTLTATDSTAGTAAVASQSYSLSIASATLAITPSTLPDGVIGTAYSQTVAASGGASPYSYAVSSGSLPAGLTLNTATGGISGTPTTTGNASFTLTATDANNATGSAAYTLAVTSQAVTLTVSPASGALTPGTVGTAYSGFVSATGGTAPYTYGATGLPAGLALNVSTGTISGTPTAAGNFSVVVTVSDSSSPANTGIANYTLEVAAGPAASFSFSPSGGALTDAMAGEAYSQTISATGGVAPLIYSLASGGLPNGVVLNVSTGELTGPLAAGSEGDYSFTIQARDNNGDIGTASYTLKVAPRAVTVDDKVISVPAGSAPANVNLAAGATGGPFVSADLTFVEPANAGTVSIVNGEFAQAGGPTPTGWYLKFIPNPAYSGQVRVGFRLTSALGVSNAGTITYNIGFNTTQVAEDIDNLVRGFVQTRQNMIASSVKVPGLMERRRMATATDPVTARMMPSAEGMTLGFSTSLAQLESARDAVDGGAGGYFSPFNIWIDGTFLAHNREENGNKWGNFAMVSAGADYLLSDKALLGVSFHYDRMTDPTNEDATLTGNGWLAGPYASFEIGRNVFWDTSLLYGGSANDIDTQFWDGTFDTSRWLFDTSIKGQWNLDEVTVLTPKLRAVYMSETVDDYSVTNGAGDILDLDGFTSEQLRASLGAEISRQVTLDNDLVLTPKIGATAGFSGLDGSGAFGQVSAGLSMQTSHEFSIDFGLLFNIEGDGGQSAGARVGVSGRF
ncbi:hemagglutinin [Rhizobium skierniewicense]|nr:hemagglutinin [Rhizobium skierniewicense]